MNKNLVIVAGVLAVIGLVINVAVDRDNVYDMTLAALWALTLILAFAGAFVGGKKPSSTSASTSPSTGQSSMR